MPGPCEAVVIVNAQTCPGCGQVRSTRTVPWAYLFHFGNGRETKGATRELVRLITGSEF
jgi:hypothetical protein